jgi:HEAT repeat protein
MRFDIFELKDREDIAGLQSLLLGDDESIREDVIDALAQLGLRAQPALECAIADKRQVVRQLALRCLGRIAHPSFVPLLTKALGDESPEVRRESTGALGALGDAATPVLVDALNNTDEGVRRIAARLLASKTGKTVLDALSAALRQDRDPSVRCIAAKSLGAMSNRTGVATLCHALSDSDPEVRRTSIDSLRKLGELSAVPLLSKLLRDEEATVRRTAAEALGVLRSEEAVPALVNTACHDLPAVRWSAAQAILSIASAKLPPTDKDHRIMAARTLAERALAGTMSSSIMFHGCHDLDALERQFRSRAPHLRDSTPRNPATNLANIRFTVFHPKEAAIKQWQTMLVYIHIDAVLDQVRRDARRFIDELAQHTRELKTPQAATLERGTTIRLEPKATGLIFNPSSVTIAWNEDFERVVFRFSASDTLVERPCVGELFASIGPIDVARVAFSVYFKDQDGRVLNRDPSFAEACEYMYQKIFASYSHDDSALVSACIQALTAIGHTVLVDYDTLKSGQIWDRALEGMIRGADIFQLFWSHNAAKSPWVEREWQCALDQFKNTGLPAIRPVTWEDPPPSYPSTLSQFHFKHMPSLVSLFQKGE